MMLSNKSLTEDLLTYGYVINANNLRLKVILPGGFTGYVDPTHVSNAYTDTLKKLLHSDNEETKVETFQSLFPVGSFVICKMMNPKSNQINLSLNPKYINQNIFASQIKANMILVGSINSVEDHGYVMDFGITHISAFLHNKDAEEHIEIFNKGKPLHVGQQLRCLILSAPSDNQKDKNESRTVKVTIDPFAVDSAVMVPSMNLSYEFIQPGLKTEVKIVKAQSNCLDVKFQNYEGTIPKVYWNLSEKKFKNDTVVEATVVYVDHQQKLLTFSLLTHYHNPVSDLFPNYKVGQTKSGIVQSVNHKIGIYLGLPNGILGLADLQGLSSKGSSSMEEAYAVGSEHKCRVIGFLPIENSVQVSVKSSQHNTGLYALSCRGMKPGVMLRPVGIEHDTKFLTIKDIIPGVLITCHVKKFLETGVLVSVNEKLAGLIRSYHVDDDLTKSPEELFGEGDKVTCRILSIQLKTNKVFLTCKKSLVETKLPIVFRFDQIKKEMLLEGFIRSVNDNGAVIAFYGDLIVWVPQRCFQLDPDVLLTSVYKVGRLIKCRVSKVIPEEEKFFIVLPECVKTPKKTPVEDNIPDPEMTKEIIKKLRRVPIAIDIPAPEVGELCKCVLYKKTDKSFNCFLIPSKNSALIPKMHLSDSEEMCEKIWNNYQANQFLDVVIFEKKNQFIVASHKQTLIKAAEDKTVVSSFQDLKVGQILVGVVQNVVDYGVFVEFPGHLIGLARKQSVHQNNLVTDNLFKPGRTVKAKVTEVNKKTHKFGVSLLICDMGIEPNYDLKLLRRTFKENKEFAKTMKEKKGPEWLLTKLTVGTLCSVVITAVSEKGASCVFKNGAKGFVPKQHTEGQELKKGLTVNALIIDVDHASNSVQLCLSSTIILYAKKIASKPKPVPANTQMQSIVLLNKPHYLLVMLTTKVKGQLAYLCPKIHENDVTSHDRFSINEQLKVQYVKNIRDKVVVKLDPEDEKFSKMKVPKKIKKSKSTKKRAASDKENIGKGKKNAKAALNSAELNGSAVSATTEEKKGKKRKAEEESSNKVKAEKKLKKKKCEEMEENDDKSDAKDKVLDVMPPIFFNWDETPRGKNNRDDHSEDEMIQDETNNKHSKKSKKAKLKEHQQKEEQRLYEIERKRLEGEKQLETAKDFDCLVLNSPNSSLLWLRYMAFHLETAEVDKAREVAERALKTISFREEQEKFNVWVGYLNLENLYGTKEKLTKVLEQALQQNQAMKVYQQLVNIYVKSGKFQEAEDVHHILLKRFRSEKSVWVNYGIFCYKNANLEEGRKLVQRTVKTLDKKDHVSLIVKIAQLEFKYGEAERGKTMFENIVSNFPKRTDLWSVYIDMTIQQADNNAVRNLFERVTNLRLSTRKMKFFFKKYLDFEQKHGTPELVMAIRKKALEYVEDSHETESGPET